MVILLRVVVVVVAVVVVVVVVSLLLQGRVQSLRSQSCKLTREMQHSSRPILGGLCPQTG